MNKLFSFIKKRYLIIVPILLLIFVAQIERYSELTSSGTFGAALRLSIPICLAGVGAIYSERCGIVNIGLEGMMVIGTWFGAWAGWFYGPWYGVLAGLLGGALFGLIHAVGTITFQVDHIVSGVAINILAAGVARFLSVVAYADVPAGGATQSPRVDERIEKISIPYLSGGKINESDTADVFGSLEALDLFFISDLFGLLGGLTRNISYFSILAILLVPVSVWILWSTSFGLQLRSVGEYPVGSESVGVNVYLMKYIGVTISGAFAGLAGAYLVIESAGIYREGQTGGRGFIGLAAMIFGNWKPFGTFLGSSLFGYADSLQLRSEESVHGLLIIIVCVLFVVGIRSFIKKNLRTAIVSFIFSGLFLFWFLNSSTIPNEFVFFTPHITTLIVLSFASQRLRMPKFIGKAYKKGELN